MAAAAMLLLAAACTKTPEPGRGGDAIGFRASSTAVKSVGSQETDDTNITGGSIGLYGYYSPDRGGSSVTNVFGTTEAVRLSYGQDGWTYSPLAYWHRSQHYRFRAFHPYDAHIVSGSDADDLIIATTCWWRSRNATPSLTAPARWSSTSGMHFPLSASG